jgi:hypothetical protein
MNDGVDEAGELSDLPDVLQLKQLLSAVVHESSIKHEFVKRLHARFNDEGSVIPFPNRTLAHREPLPDAQAHRMAGAA